MLQVLPLPPANGMARSSEDGATLELLDPIIVKAKSMRGADLTFTSVSLWTQNENDKLTLAMLSQNWSLWRSM